MVVLVQLSQIMAEKAGQTHFTHAGLDKLSNCNCSYDIVLTYDPQRLTTQSSMGQGAGMGPVIGPLVGTLNGALA